MALLAHKLLASRAGQSVGGIQFVGYNYTERTATTTGWTFTFGTWLGGVGGSLAQNDLLILAHQSTSTNDLVPLGGIDQYGPDATNPETFTQIADLYANDTADTNLYVGWHRCGASPPSQIKMNGGDETTNSHATSALVLAFRGVNTTTALDVTSTTATGTNGSQADGASITPITAGARIISIGAAARASGGTSDKSGPSNMTLIVGESYNTTAALGILRAAQKTDWTSGAFNPDAWTGTTAGADSWAACTIALRPA